VEQDKNMIGPALSNFVALRNATINATWSSLVYVSRSICLSVLSKIQIGQLQIVDVDGNITVLGEAAENPSGPKCVLQIRQETFWLRLALYGDMVSA
jgi:hypothetical protein